MSDAPPRPPPPSPVTTCSDSLDPSALDCFLFHHSPAALLLVNPSEQFILCSSIGARRLLNYDYEGGDVDLTRVRPEDFFTEGSLASGLADLRHCAAADRDEVVSYGINVRRSDGSAIPVHAKMTSFKPPSGSGLDPSTRYMLVHITEIVADTEHTRQQKELSRLEAVGQFAAAMAHKQNNSMVGVMSAADLLLREPGLSPATIDILHEIVSNASDAAKATEHFTTFVKQNTSWMRMNYSLIDVDKVIQQTLATHVDQIHPLAPSPRPEVRVTVDGPKGAQLRGDELHMRALLANLVANAFEAQAGRPRNTLRKSPDDSKVGVASHASEKQEQDEPIEVIRPFIHIRASLVPAGASEFTVRELLPGLDWVQGKDILDTHIALPHKIRTEVAAEQTYFALIVCDNGVGMTDTVISRSTELFFTTKGSASSGIGLATSASIVRNHGGKLAIVSRPGVGTAVVVFLPYQLPTPSVDRDTKGSTAESTEALSDGARRTRTRRPSRDTAPHGLRVMIVDDDPIVRTTLSRMVKAIGHRVEQMAVDGQEALDVFDKDLVDLVLLDMRMPRLNGRQTFEGLIKIDPKVNVLIVSAYSDDEEIAEVIRSGAKGLVKKPFIVKGLRESIRVAMHPPVKPFVCETSGDIVTTSPG